MTDFSGLKLGPALLQAIADEGYHTPTPIQQKAIPHLLEGRDLLGIAQTGTGKTAAFTLPLLQTLQLTPRHSGKAPRRKPHHVRALLLAPTRELAAQIADNIRGYGRFLSLRSMVAVGGVSARPQIKALQGGVDILVATPGRLLDLMNAGHVRLDDTRNLVLDEADQMLDMGFIRDIRKIIAKLPARRQTVMFSATMSTAIGKLATDILDRPARVEIASKSVAVERIAQFVHHLTSGAKQQRLHDLLGAADMSKVIVFTRTKRGADRVVKRLGKDGIPAQALHGNKSQNARKRALEGFRNGRTRVLVATDIAARGLDVADVSHVINYELPTEPESYVHRIGRTARGMADGTAISFCDHSERAQLRAIERLIKRQLRVVGETPGEPSHAPQAHRPRARRPRPAGQRKYHSPGHRPA